MKSSKKEQKSSPVKNAMCSENNTSEENLIVKNYKRRMSDIEKIISAIEGCTMHSYYAECKMESDSCMSILGNIRIMREVIEVLNYEIENYN